SHGHRRWSPPGAWPGRCAGPPRPAAKFVSARSASSHGDAAESGDRSGVADPGLLDRLALAAVRKPPQVAGAPVADGVHRGPERGRHSRVDRVADHSPELPAYEPAAELGPELEVEASVVDRPGAVNVEVDPFLHAFEELLEARVPRLQIDVRHADEGGAVAARGPGRPARA